MILVERLRRHLGWSTVCEAGPPVPGPDGCPGLDCDSVRLTSLRPGARGSVSCLERPGSAESAKLAGLGVVPGARIRLVQRYPAWVFRLGRAEIALDEGLAAHIRVREDR
jgi:DtxR family Mn-dependent transcriptional regulator